MESFFDKATITAQDLEQYDGLIFDMDGTIIDSLPAHCKACIELGKIYDFPVDTQVIIDNTGTTPVNIIRALLVKAGKDPEKAPEYLPTKMEMVHQYLGEMTEKLPAWELLELYKGKKPMGVGTGSPESFVSIFRKKFNIEDYFGQAIVTSDQVSKLKPDPETFLTVAKRLNVEPSKCIVFEDGKFGIQSALAGGMDAYDVVNHKLYKASEYNKA